MSRAQDTVSKCLSKASRQSVVKQLNQEFEQLLSLENGKYREIFFWQINRAIWCRIALQVVVTVIVILSAVSITFYVPHLNWSASAVGRIALIRSLPYLNWTSLHKDRCLWEKSVEQTVPRKYQEDLSCDFCENINTIPITIGLGPTEFEQFIRHHQPFLVQQSHPLWSSADIREFLLNTADLTSSIPCNVQTNVHATRSSRIAQLFEHTLDLTTIHQIISHWFLSFRNCEFAATKSLRLLWPRPEFVPLYLRPYHTSWLIVSHTYSGSSAKPLAVRDLVVVAQLTGRRKLRLIAANCASTCEELMIDIGAGESFVFSADFWHVNYEVNQDDHRPDQETSVTFVAEFIWDWD